MIHLYGLCLDALVLVELRNLLVKTIVKKKTAKNNANCKNYEDWK